MWCNLERQVKLAERTLMNEKKTQFLAGELKDNFMKPFLLPNFAISRALTLPATLRCLCQAKNSKKCVNMGMVGKRMEIQI